jgi:serine protease Do
MSVPTNRALHGHRLTLPYRVRCALLGTIAAALLTTGLACQTGPPRPAVEPPPPLVAERLREDVRQMVSAARDRVFPALVNIHVVTLNYWGGKEQKGAAVGSGTIISPDGYVVTNQHVTTKGRQFKCILTDQREVNAVLVGEDPLTDLAVLKLETAPLGMTAPLPVARFGDSDKLAIGDTVLAMGSPFALARSVTLGIVSNTDRVFGGEFGGDELEELQLDPGQRTGLFTNWIQHDAAIHPGSSGGPLVNLDGEVVGVNELGSEQMGFAIPSNLARSVVTDLIAHGEVPRSDIGLSFKAIHHTGLTHGVLVNSVDKSGPAGRAGLQAGDVITRLNGDALTVRFLEQVPALMKRVAELPIGAPLAVTYERNGQPATVLITTEKLQKDRGDEAAFRGWGLTAMDITDKIARDRRLKDDEGVLVSSLRPGGPAALAEPPLGSGDVVRAIDGRPVHDLPGFSALYSAVMARQPLPDYVLVEFDRHGQDQVTLLKPKPDEEVDPPREVRKAWLGVATQPMLKDLAAQLGYPGRTGFRITRVYPGTQAAKSGLRVGDVVVALNDEELAPRNVQDAGLLARQVRRLDIDGEATLGVLRDGGEQPIAVKLEPTRLTPEEARRDRNRDFDLTVRELTFFDRDQNRWDDDVTGVLVEQVEDAGWAGLGGIQPGDLIQQIEGQPVRGLESYRRIMAAIHAQQPERVVFVVLRGVRTHFQFVEPDWNPVVPPVSGTEE